MFLSPVFLCGPSCDNQCMRPALLLLTVTCLSAAEVVPAEQRAVNTICPVSGLKVDAALKPVAVRTADGRSVQVGVADAECATVVSKDPVRYATLAEANRFEKKK